MKKLVTIILALMLTAAVATGCADNSAKDNDKPVDKIENEIENNENDDVADDENDADADDEDKIADGEEETNGDEDKSADDEQPEVPEIPVQKPESDSKPEADKKPEADSKPAEDENPTIDTNTPVILPGMDAPAAPGEPEVSTPVMPTVPTEPEVETPDSSAGTVTATPAGLEGKTAEEIIELILEHNAPQFFYGTMQVDKSDANSFKVYTGLSSTDGVIDAAVCEPMMGSQAYSMTVLVLDETADAKAIAETMKANINPRKWVCVEANDIKASGCGNIVMFIMIDSEFKEDVTAASATEAFKTVCGGSLDFEL